MSLSTVVLILLVSSVLLYTPENHRNRRFEYQERHLERESPQNVNLLLHLLLYLRFYLIPYLNFKKKKNQILSIELCKGLMISWLTHSYL